MERQIELLKKQEDELYNKAQAALGDVFSYASYKINELFETDQLVVKSIQRTIRGYFWEAGDEPGYEIQICHSGKSINTMMEIEPEGKVYLSWYSSSIREKLEELDEDDVSHLKYLSLMGHLAEKLLDPTFIDRINEVHDIVTQEYAEKALPLQNDYYAMRRLRSEKEEELKQIKEDEIKDELLKKLRSGMVWVGNHSVLRKINMNSRYTFSWFYMAKENPKTFIIKDDVEEKRVNKEELLYQLISYEQRPITGMRVIDWESVQHDHYYYRVEGHRWITKEEMEEYREKNGGLRLINDWNKEETTEEEYKELSKY